MLAAAFTLAAGVQFSVPATAQDALSQMVSGGYGKRSALHIPGSKNRPGSAQRSSNVYRAFMYGKGSYEARMAHWGRYCDHRGDLEAYVGAGIRDVPLPGTNLISTVVERPGQQSENACHYDRTAFMTQYERARSEKDNEEFVSAISAKIAVLADIQDKQVTPEVVEIIIEKTVEAQRQMLIKEIEELSKKPTPPAPEPVPAKPEPAKPEGSEVPSVQAPVTPQPKAEAPKPKETVPPVKPSKADPEKEPPPAVTPDMAKAKTNDGRVHPDVAFNPARNK
jgi:hypothetical protein